MGKEIQSYETLGISNDFMFGKIMQDSKICKMFLERILGIKIDHIEYIEAQKTIDRKVDAKGIRLDIYVDDGETVYNCEMQTSGKRDLHHRTRYYQGYIDINLIQKGTDYRDLKKSFVIFVCTFDPFGKGSYVYTFRNVCKEFPDLELGDETYKVFLSTVGQNPEQLPAEVVDLLHYIGDSKLPEGCTDSLICAMDSALVAARSNEEWRHDYMTLELLKSDYIEKGREEGRAEGRAEGEIRDMVFAYSDSGKSEEEIVNKVGISIKEVRDILKNK